MAHPPPPQPPPVSGACSQTPQSSCPHCCCPQRGHLRAARGPVSPQHSSSDVTLRAQQHNCCSPDSPWIGTSTGTRPGSQGVLTTAWCVTCTVGSGGAIAALYSCFCHTCLFLCPTALPAAPMPPPDLAVLWQLQPEDRDARVSSGSGRPSPSLEEPQNEDGKVCNFVIGTPIECPKGTYCCKCKHRHRHKVNRLAQHHVRDLFISFSYQHIYLAVCAVIPRVSLR